MIVDIGSGITEVTLLSLNGIVRTRAVRSAGDALDAAIVQYVRDQYGLLIGNGVAEWLKIRYGSLAPLQDRGTAEISGRGIRSGLPATVRLGTAELREAMTPWFDDLCDLLQQTLNETPPELAADLYDHGIVLCGGGALLWGLSKRIEERIGLRTVLARNPMECVCMGIGRMLESDR
jgi:rod shape-determining protein MreB